MRIRKIGTSTKDWIVLPDRSELPIAQGSLPECITFVASDGNLMSGIRTGNAT